MNHQHQISIRQNFAVGVKELFSAWTDEKQLKQWWKPMNKTLAQMENDMKAGGRISYAFENDLQIAGTYKEVVPEKILVYSWNWQMPDDSHHKGEYNLTVNFNGDDSQSSIEVMQENFKSEHSVQPHREGWEEGLQALKDFLEKARLG